MVERSEQQHDVGRRVECRQGTCVTLRGGERAVPGGLLDVPRDRVDQQYVVAERSQPRRVDAGTAADVEYAGRRRWQESEQQLSRAVALEPAQRTAGEPVGFVEPGVVVGVDVRM